MPKRQINLSKEKKITRHFSHVTNDKLIIKNIFGNVHVNTWNKNEIDISVSIVGKFNTESKAQDLLDHVSIKESKIDKYTNTLSFESIIEKPYNNRNPDNVNIDYIVNVPKILDLEINNKFGMVYLDDFEGKLLIDIMFGSLSAKNISGPPAIIKINFSKGKNTISSIEKGDITCSGGLGEIIIDHQYDTANVKLTGWSQVIIGKIK